MKMFKLNGINKKISLLVTLIIVVSLLAMSALNYIIARRELNRSNDIILENAVEATMVQINRNYSYTVGDKKQMTEEQAKEASLASLKSLQDEQTDGVSSSTESTTDATSSATANSVFADHTLNLGESGYFYIINSEGDIISHPFMEGNIYDLKANDGSNIIQEVISLAKSGGGAIDYTLSGDVSEIMDGKTVFVKYFPQWDWVVAAVIYHKDLARGSSLILFNNMIGLVITLIISLFLVIWLSGRITKPIKKISNTLYEVSNGDLTQERIILHTKDETKLLGDSLNRLLEKFQHMVKMMMSSSDRLDHFARDLNESSRIMSEATTEVTKAITQMAVLTEEQFKETQDSVTQVTMLGEDIKHTAEAGTRIENVAQKNLILKEEGISSVNNLKEANLINQENSLAIEQVVNQIDEYSQDIGEITNIITNVAKQTNLLALNASIEASRAGEHGLGFNVVAEEIRKLANETSAATGNIRRRIDQMQEQSKEAVKFIQINKSGVEKINDTVLQTEVVINNIAEGLEQLIEGIQSIAEKNIQINTKKDSILKMLNHVADAAEENSASNEEISATAQEQTSTIVEISSSISHLHNMIQELNNLINQFKINEEAKA